MEFPVKTGAPASQRTECAILPIFDDGPLVGAAVGASVGWSVGVSVGPGPSVGSTVGP